MQAVAAKRGNVWKQVRERKRGSAFRILALRDEGGNMTYEDKPKAELLVGVMAGAHRLEPISPGNLTLLEVQRSMNEIVENIVDVPQEDGVTIKEIRMAIQGP